MGEIVECHSNHTYAERPIALHWEGNRLEIIEITAQWRTPDKKYFRVRASDGQKFELSYDEATTDTRDKMPGYDWQISPIQEK
jgi:hypothetical protein